MIHERYYSDIKNYQRDDGKAFMENVYNAAKNEKVDRKEEKVVSVECNELVTSVNLVNNVLRKPHVTHGH
jgi:hypothetical protein